MAFINMPQTYNIWFKHKNHFRGLQSTFEKPPPDYQYIRSLTAQKYFTQILHVTNNQPHKK